MLGRVGRNRHKKKNIFYEPTSGIAPLTVRGTLPNDEFELLWEVVDEFNMQPIKQIVLKDASNRCFQIPFRRGVLTKMLIDSLVRREKLGKIVTVMYTSHDKADLEEMEELCADYATEGRTFERPFPDAGGQVKGQMLVELSKPYLRAIAKIGLHYVLQYFPKYTGLEPEFDDIKRFIYSGVGRDHDFVRVTPEQFILEFRKGYRLRNWGHLLTAQNDHRSIEARMQFFAGPSVTPLVWRVLVGRDPSRIYYPEQKGSMFRYFDRFIDGYEGERVELTANSRIFI